MDRIWIQEFGMPSHTLMELAGRKAAEHIGPIPTRTPSYCADRETMVVMDMLLPGG